MPPPSTKDCMFGHPSLPKYVITNSHSTCSAKVKEEVTADPNAAGSVDLIWINGNNFKNLKTDGNAYGPWANLVPNSKNFDFSSPSIKNDFGFATEGYEMPYNQAQ